MNDRGSGGQSTCIALFAQLIIRRKQVRPLRYFFLCVKPNSFAFLSHFALLVDPLVNLLVDLSIFLVVFVLWDVRSFQNSDGHLSACASMRVVCRQCSCLHFRLLCLFPHILLYFPLQPPHRIHHLEDPRVSHPVSATDQSSALRQAHLVFPVAKLWELLFEHTFLLIPWRGIQQLASFALGGHPEVFNGLYF